MIDWITAVVPCMHAEDIYGGRLARITRDGEIAWQMLQAESVLGSHDARFSVQTRAQGLLWISGNPAKWMQGHNLFGSDDLRGLVEATMVRIVQLLKLTPQVSDFAAWRTGAYELLRVDCTAMWTLPKRHDVRAWLRAVETQAKSRHGRAISTGGTVYFGKHSRRWALKFYAKGDELMAKAKGHKLPFEIAQRDRLIDYADNKLRGEVTLRSMQLKKLGLDRASAWDFGTTHSVLLNHIASVQMAEQFSLTPDTLDGLPPRLVLVYEAWKRGKDLRQMFAIRTFYRYRKELLKHGIDINVRQPPEPENVIPLVRVLRPEAIAQVPDWAVGTDLYFEPKRRVQKVG